MILGLATLHLRRSAVQAWGSDGRASATTTDSTFSGSWQPLDGREIAMLPEGERASDRAKVFTATLLRTTDQRTGTPADLVSQDGSAWFKVLEVRPYSANAPLPHYRVELARVQEG